MEYRKAYGDLPKKPPSRHISTESSKILFEEDDISSTEETASETDRSPESHRDSNKDCHQSDDVS